MPSTTSSSIRVKPLEDRRLLAVMRGLHQRLAGGAAFATAVECQRAAQGIVKSVINQFCTRCCAQFDTLRNGLSSTGVGADLVSTGGCRGARKPDETSLRIGWRSLVGRIAIVLRIVAFLLLHGAQQCSLGFGAFGFVHAVVELWISQQCQQTDDAQGD